MDIARQPLTVLTYGVVLAGNASRLEARFARNAALGHFRGSGEPNPEKLNVDRHLRFWVFWKRFFLLVSLSNRGAGEAPISEAPLATLPVALVEWLSVDLALPGSLSH